MGIPSYFSWIVRHFEKSIINHKSPYDHIDQFYLDFNCGIHPVVRSHPELDIDQMCDNVVKYLDYLINVVNPTELIYVAMDGVAPLAKIKQQRLRRYKSIKETKEKDQLKAKYGVKQDSIKQDFNMISPATEFMFILSQKIQNYLMTIKNNRQIILDDTSVPSEGEHKILQHVKKQTNGKKVVIYGLDSDLIMLSLCSEHSDIMLLRESTTQDSSIDHVQLDYFLVDNMRSIIYNILVSECDIGHMTEDLLTLPNKSDDQSWSVKYIVRDYVFISYMLGNDFVPPIPTLRIRENGIEQIITAYRTTLRKYRTYLLNENITINYDFLMNMMNLLSIDEEHIMKSQKNKHEYRVKHYNNTTPQNYDEACEQYENVEHLWSDVIDVTRDGWRKRYYEYHFHINPMIESTYMQSIDEICYQYFRTIRWISLYYFDKCPDWQWMYRYNMTPLLSDFVSYLKKCSPSQLNQLFEYHEPVKPYQQLLMILPPQSINLLPHSYRSLMISDQSPLIHYFPIDFELKYYDNRYRWESNPQIPFVDPNELKLYTQHLDDNLSITERDRNQIGNPKVI